MLVFSRQSVFPGTGGSEAYSFDFLRHAAREGWDVHCVITHRNFAGGVPVYPVSPEVFRTMKVRVPGFIRVGNSLVRPRGWVKENLKRLLRKLIGKGSAPTPYKVDWSGQPADAEEQQLAAQWIAKLKPDVVLANYCWMTPCFAEAGAALKVVLTHDVMHEKSTSFIAEGLAEKSSYPDEKTERELLALAEVILAISDHDRAAFRRLLPDAEIITMLKAAQLRPLPGIVERGRCVFVGSAYAANVQGLSWFLEKVWSAVLASIPEARLRVCGKVGQKIAATPPGVELLGVCEDLDREYEAAAVVLVPLLVGSGVKIKLVEALASGKACVTTTIGVQGLDFLSPDEVCVADAPEDFAAQVTRLLTDDSARMALEKNAFAAAEKYLAPEVVYSPVLRRFGNQRAAS
jgi:glycosyltransferase involved in cell wall biosynthesis